MWHRLLRERDDLLLVRRAAGVELAKRSGRMGSTEIPLFLGQMDVEIPLFDTTRIHAEAAVEFYLTERMPDSPHAENPRDPAE